jgi:uncharacterized protein YbjT (DUF2867 family)
MGVILITGATGTVGSELVKLLSGKAEVRALAHSLEKAGMEADIEWVEIDYSRQENIRAAFNNAERLFMLTPMVGDIVKISENILAAARRYGVSHIVRLSVIEAGFRPIPDLGEQHHKIEKLIEESGLKYTILRSSPFMQNFLNIQTIKEGKIISSVGEGKAAFIDARDVALAAAAVLTELGHENKTYELTGPRAISYDDIADTLSKAKGVEIKYVDITENEAKAHMHDVRTPPELVNWMLELNNLIREGKFSKITNAVEELTGKKPRSFEDFAKEFSV